MDFNIFLCFLLLFTLTGAPPVTKTKDDPAEDDGQKNQLDLQDYMEYHRYLQEVVNALESDPDFRKKLEKAEEHEIRSGKIAEELEFVSHHVRNKLDEIKRLELKRLQELTEKKQKLLEEAENNDNHRKHVDHSNPHTFEIEDLKKLIAKTTEDLAEADKKRRDEFKQYELEKEFEKQAKLNHTNGSEREKLEKEYQQQEEKHKKHEKLHEPGHKAQLEEVWEKQDQMDQEFNPKTFFMLHDLDGNSLWDQNEVKALFIRELNKMYDAGAPEDDIRERAEEMERMRETVFKEVDLNRDGFIDYNEFLAQTRTQDFQEDHGWNGLDEQKPYTDEELQEYIRQHQMQGYNAPPGYHQPMPNQQYYQPVPGQHGVQMHPGQAPPPYGGHPPPAHMQQLNTNEIYPNSPSQGAPPQGYHPAAQQYHPNQVNYQNPQYNNHIPPNVQNIHQQQYQPPHPANVQYQQPPQPGVQNPYQPPNVQNVNPPQPQQINPQQSQGNVPPSQGNVPPPQGNFAPPQGNVPPPQGNFAPPQGNIPPPQGNIPQPQVNIPPQPAVPNSNNQAQPNGLNVNQAPSPNNQQTANQQQNLPNVHKANEQGQVSPQVVKV